MAFYTLKTEKRIKQMFSGADMIHGICPSGSNDSPFRLLKHEYSYIGGRKTTAYANNGNRMLQGDTTEMLMSLLPLYANKLEYAGLDYYEFTNENTAVVHDRLLTNLRLSAALLKDTGILLVITNRASYKIIKAGIEEVFGPVNLVADFTNRVCNNDTMDLQHLLLFNRGSMGAQQREHLNRCFSGKRFSNMLPADLIRHCIYVACSKEAILLNTISGCDNIVAPVLYLNKQDKGNRKFLLLCPGNAKAVYEPLQLMLAQETDFDCYIPGNNLFMNDANERLNTDLPAKQIREYIWYAETGAGFIDNGFWPSEPYLLGILNNTAIYLMYEYDAFTILNQDFLSGIKTIAGQYIVYANQCALSSEQLQSKKIQFKQIPQNC